MHKYEGGRPGRSHHVVMSETDSLRYFLLPDPELAGEVNELEGVPSDELYCVLYSR